jgi:hypothetical protein
MSQITPTEISELRAYLGPRPASYEFSFNGARIAALLDALEAQVSATDTLRSSAILNENEHGDNESVTIPIASWRTFNEAF